MAIVHVEIRHLPPENQFDTADRVKWMHDDELRPATVLQWTRLLKNSDLGDMGLSMGYETWNQNGWCYNFYACLI